MHRLADIRCIMVEPSKFTAATMQTSFPTHFLSFDLLGDDLPIMLIVPLWLLIALANSFIMPLQGGPNCDIIRDACPRCE
jgi:uncharacterized membrane protein